MIPLVESALPMRTETFGERTNMSQNEKKVALLHTAYPIIGQLEPLVKEIIPEIKVVNMLDEDILPYLSEKGRVTAKVNRKIYCYALSAEEMGASAILLTCSSISPCADFISPLVHIPILKIDKPMVEKAVRIGDVVGVVATLSSTLNPTKELILNEGRKKGKDIIIKDCLCEDAFQALLSGNTKEHDTSIISGIKRLSQKVDVVVLAQVSMAKVVSQIKNLVKVPVLTSPRSGVEQLRQVLNLKDKD